MYNKYIVITADLLVEMSPDLPEVGGGSLLFDTEKSLLLLNPLPGSREARIKAWEAEVEREVGALATSALVAERTTECMQLSEARFELTPDEQFIQGIRDIFKRGELPTLGNGWQFVIDRRPPGKEGEDISPLEYTAYFVQRKIPVADIDHDRRDHDERHAPSFVLAFNYAAFADTTAAAAQNANGDLALSQRFTGAIDGFGNAIQALWTSTRGSTSNVLAAQLRLSELVDLACRNNVATAEEFKRQQFSELWRSLGLTAFEQLARIYAASQQRDFSAVEYCSPKSTE